MSFNVDFDSAALGQLAWTQIWQVAAVVIAVTMVTRIGMVRRRPHLAYALWLLVLVKCLTPPLVASPTSPFSWALAEMSPPVDTTQRDPAPTAVDAAGVETPAMPIDETQPIEPGLPLNSEPLHAPADVPVVELSEPALPLGQAATNWMTLGMALFALWAIGAAAYATVALLRLRRICRRLAHDGRHETASVDGVVSELTSAFGLHKSPHVIFTPRPFGPALVGLFRPTLVVPDLIRHQLSHEQLRLVLAHELVHLRRRDHWIGLVQFAAQAVWWFNPLVWWANRELNRVREQCCDEEVVARLHCEPAGYAQTLLDILRLGPQLRPVFFASGVRALQVTEERLKHIMSDSSRFHRGTPRTYWLAAGLAAVLLLPGAGLALNQAHLTAEASPKIGDEEQNRATKDKRQAQEATYTGRVVDHETGKPIEGAVVLVQRITRKKHMQNDIDSTEHKTDSRGEYQFVLSANPAEHGRRFITSTLADPRFVTVKHAYWEVPAADGRAAVSGRARVETIEAVAGEQISGDVQAPDGTPLADVKVRMNHVAATSSMYTPSSEAVTDKKGRFSGTVLKGKSVDLFIESAEFVPRLMKIGTKRGDLGSIRLSAGLTVTGKVLDPSGDPVYGAWVSIQAPIEREPHYDEQVIDDSEIDFEYQGLIISTPFRSVPTDADGRFVLPGVKVGEYWMTVSDRPSRPADMSGEPIILPSAYERQTVVIRAGEMPPEIIIRPVPSLTIEAQFFNSGGKPARSFEGALIGEYRGEPYFAWLRTMDNAKAIARAPNGTKNLQIQVLEATDHRFKYRLSKEEPLRSSQDPDYINLGSPTSDLRSIEIVSETLPAAEQAVPEAEGGDGIKSGDSHETAGQQLTFTGTVIERAIKKPIEGARVTITRYAPKGTGYDVVGTSEHRTDTEGRYEFTLGPDLKGHERFLIRPVVAHDKYVSIRGGNFGVSLAEEVKRPPGIRQLQPIEVTAAETIRGTIESPEGKPGAGVPIVVKSLTAAGHPELPEGISSRVDAQTDAQGRFSAEVIKQASAAMTIESPNHAPRVVMVGQKRGELGRIRLAQGISLTGTVVDPEGRPVEGVWVNAFSVPDEPSFMWLEDSGEFRQGGNFAEQVTRADRTDEQGKFDLNGLGPGKYTVMVMDRSEDFRQPAGEMKPLPAAFLRQEITLKEGQPRQQIEIRALPSLTIEVAFVDTAGKPVEAQEGMVISGTYQGQDFGAFLRKTAPDKIVVKVPQGIRNLTLPLEMSGVRYRVSKDQPLRAGREIKLGTPAGDIRDIQVVKYNEPQLLVRAVDQAGKPIKDFKPKIEYPPGVKEPLPPGAHFATGVVGDVFLRRLPDGRWRTGGLLPDQEFTVSAEPEGYQPASQKLKLAEGETKEVTLRLTNR